MPREQLLLIIRSFGGTVAWDGDGSPHAEADEAVTHQASGCAVPCHAASAGLMRFFFLISSRLPCAGEHVNQFSV